MIIYCITFDKGINSSIKNERDVEEIVDDAFAVRQKTRLIVFRAKEIKHE